MAVDSLYKTSGKSPFQGPYSGVNTFAPFVLAMDILKGDFGFTEGFVAKMNQILKDSDWPYQLKMSDRGTQAKLYDTANGKFVDWRDLYVVLETLPSLDELFKKFLNGAFSVAKTNNVYNREGGFWDLTDKCMNVQGYISEQDVEEMSRELILWMYPNMKSQQNPDHTEAAVEFKSFLSFVYLISNRIEKNFFDSRPATPELADDFNKWYVWPSLGMFNGVLEFVTGNTGIKNKFWDGYTMDTIQLFAGVNQFINQDLADDTYKNVKRLQSYGLDETMSATTVANLYSLIPNNKRLLIPSDEAYKYTIGIALNSMYYFSAEVALDFVDALFEGGGKTSVNTQTSNSGMQRVQEVLSKAVFLDSQNRAEFVQEQIGNFDDLAEEIGYEKAELIFEILDELSKEENARMTGKPAVQVAVIEEQEVPAEEAEEVVIEEDDLGLDDLLDDILDDEELDELLDLDLGLEDLE